MSNGCGLRPRSAGAVLDPLAQQHRVGGVGAQRKADGRTHRDPVVADVFSSIRAGQHAEGHASPIPWRDLVDVEELQ